MLLAAGDTILARHRQESAVRDGPPEASSAKRWAARPALGFVIVMPRHTAITSGVQVNV